MTSTFLSNIEKLLSANQYETLHIPTTSSAYRESNLDINIQKDQLTNDDFKYRSQSEQEHRILKTKEEQAPSINKLEEEGNIIYIKYK